MAAIHREEIERQCSEDYDAIVGKVVLVTEIECYDQNECSVTVYCDPPAIARIDPYTDGSRNECVIRWMDDAHCDPVYDISVLEHHAAFELANARPSWVYGICRSTAGDVELASIVVASDDLQKKYESAESVSYLDIGPKDGPSVGYS